MFLLQFGFEIRERRHSTLRVLVNPAVVDQADRHRVEEVQLFPARPAHDDEARAFEDAKVLHDTEARHLQFGLELGERAAVTLEEPVEEEAARRVGERLEHEVVVRHDRMICDQMVTCQATPLNRSEGSIRSASNTA
jgi:hypothetical protein